MFSKGKKEKKMEKKKIQLSPNHNDMVYACCHRECASHMPVAFSLYFFKFDL
jgi:hypothetical protein